jgi:hypothetical protein|tara:strand:- start:900 stop:1142 length:243 start_codon:yes stop_codon:yes gene_type:complete
MKVGDLVKAYDFSHVARKKLTEKQATSVPSPQKWLPDRINAHHIGIVVAATDNDPKYRRVWRCVDGEWEDYNVNRLEVIA